MAAKYRVGDEVAVDDPKFRGVWTVRKVNPTTYLLDPKHGGRSLKCSHSMAVDAPADGEFGVPYVARDTFYAGMLVRSSDPRLPETYVVLVDKGERVNVAKLGGDNGRYWRVNPLGLRIVDPSALTCTPVTVGPTGPVSAPVVPALTETPAPAHVTTLAAMSSVQGDQYQGHCTCGWASKPSSKSGAGFSASAHARKANVS